MVVREVLSLLSLLVMLVRAEHIRTASKRMGELDNHHHYHRYATD